MVHLICMTDAAPNRRLRKEEKTMELAAFLMCVSVVLGVFLQLNERSW